MNDVLKFDPSNPDAEYREQIVKMLDAHSIVSCWGHPDDFFRMTPDSIKKKAEQMKKAMRPCWRGGNEDDR